MTKLVVAMVAVLVMGASLAEARPNRVYRRPVIVRRPVVRHYYVPRPVLLPRVYPVPVVYHRPMPMYAPASAVQPAQLPVVEQKLQIPAGFVEETRRVHKHGSDAGLVDWVKGRLGDRRVKIEFNPDGSRREMEEDD